MQRLVGGLSESGFAGFPGFSECGVVMCVGRVFIRVYKCFREIGGENGVGVDLSGLAVAGWSVLGAKAGARGGLDAILAVEGGCRRVLGRGWAVGWRAMGREIQPLLRGQLISVIFYLLLSDSRPAMTQAGPDGVILRSHR